MIVALLSGIPVIARQTNTVSLANDQLSLKWSKKANGYQLLSVSVKKDGQWIALPHPSGAYTILYSRQLPDSIPSPVIGANGQPVVFPEPQYRYLHGTWKEATAPVEMNTAGTAYQLYPSAVRKEKNGLVFAGENAFVTFKASWQLDAAFAGDVRVQLEVTVKQAGYYSVASPTLVNLNNTPIQWATVPGIFQGNALNNNFINAFAYGHGLPDKPVVIRERTISTLASIITTSDAISLAVVPEPGTGRDPWQQDRITQNNWRVGLSHMNRQAQLMPTAYHPVLGEEGSQQQKGNTIRFGFRYVLQPGDWYSVFKHAVEDIYRFSDFLALKDTRRSLTDRILDMQRYGTQDSTSMWQVYDFEGSSIGAQRYLGGVHDSDKDALKNSDYGAMWMMARIANDTVLQRTRLPYARNFKLKQQHQQPGFFQGAAAGQYYLSKSKKFTEEWGAYSEPIGTTYYMLMDMGNILLFEPNDTALRKELRLAADRLLTWMQPNGQWVVAYDNATEQPLFTDVQDLRPTFYGLMIAYNLLKEEKYLTAACKGADWYISNAVNKGWFLGVCGDARFAPDFATGQSVQALLDLYELTKDIKYKDAALKAARIYTTSIYTHPVPSLQPKTVKGIERLDWEISQAGLSFEHGGALGSANHAGPILLASHAGLFVRLFALTQDSLFLQMARAAAWGRDAFVDPATGVASYYWNAMNKGAGPFPHHAWWQIGWITDYLLSEATLRSNGQLSFPRGFITPKVGPHQTYGFAPGTVLGQPAELLLKAGLLQLDNSRIDHFAAINRQQKKLYLVLLNNAVKEETVKGVIQYKYAALNGQPALKAGLLQGNFIASPDQQGFTATIPATGIQVISIDLQ